MLEPIMTIDLPSVAILESEEELLDYISDELSNKSGFCHKGWASHKVEAQHICVEGILWDIDDEEEE